MAAGTKRKTISINGEVLKGGFRRKKALGYKNFSQYVAYLIDKDARERPEHVTIRRESSKRHK